MNYLESEYIVKKGDTLWKIGRDCGINWRILSAYNNLKDANKIYVDQKIKIPGGQSFQLIKDFLEGLSNILETKYAVIITGLQMIVNGSDWDEVKDTLIQAGIEIAFVTIMSRIHPYAGIAATVIILLKWGYKKYFKADEK